METFQVILSLCDTYVIRYPTGAFQTLHKVLPKKETAATSTECSMTRHHFSKYPLFDHVTDSLANLFFKIMALRIFVNSKEGTSCHSSCNEDYLVRDLFCDLFPEKNIRLIALIRLYVTYQNEEIHGNTKIFDILSSGLGNTKDTALKISVGSEWK